MKSYTSRNLRLATALAAGVLTFSACAKEAIDSHAVPGPHADEQHGPAPQHADAAEHADEQHGPGPQHPNAAAHATTEPHAPTPQPAHVEVPVTAPVEHRVIEVAKGNLSHSPGVIPPSAHSGFEQEPEMTLLEGNVIYMYMTRPDDYLSKIARNEYGDSKKWRRIYSWNRNRIGDDPNLIYPFHELALYKPEDELSGFSYDYAIHVVEDGESLWSIAGAKYGNEVAWSVLFWDNEALLAAHAGMLKPGMELRIRTHLWAVN